MPRLLREEIRRRQAITDLLTRNENDIDVLQSAVNRMMIDNDDMESDDEEETEIENGQNKTDKK